MTKGMKWWLNTEIKIIGKIPSKDRVVIYAIKHQSAWETVFCTSVFNAINSFKKSFNFFACNWIIFFKIRGYSYNEGSGFKCIRKMGRNAKKAVKENRSMMIFLKVQE